MSKLKRAFSDPSVDPEVEEENGETGKPQGLRVVKGLGVLPRSRIAGASKYNIAELAVGDGFVSSESKDIRNVTVAARAYAKKIARGGGVAPKYVSRKTPEGDYALIRES